MTVVSQLQAAGIVRLGSMRAGFRYRDASGVKPARRDLTRACCEWLSACSLRPGSDEYARRGHVVSAPVRDLATLARTRGLQRPERALIRLLDAFATPGRAAPPSRSRAPERTA